MKSDLKNPLLIAMIVLLVFVCALSVHRFNKISALEEKNQQHAGLNQIIHPHGIVTIRHTSPFRFLLEFSCLEALAHIF